MQNFMTCHNQDILPCIRRSKLVKPSWEGYPISMDRNIKGVLVEIHSIQTLCESHFRG